MYRLDQSSGAFLAFANREECFAKERKEQWTCGKERRIVPFLVCKKTENSAQLSLLSFTKERNEQCTCARERKERWNVPFLVCIKRENSDELSLLVFAHRATVSSRVCKKRQVVCKKRGKKRIVQVSCRKRVFFRSLREKCVKLSGMVCNSHKRHQMSGEKEPQKRDPEKRPRKEKRDLEKGHRKKT